MSLGSSNTSRIECRVGRWFMRRMGILGILLGGGALFFLYDGHIGYPKKNFNAALYAAFMSGKSGTGEKPQAADFAFDAFAEKQNAELDLAISAGKSGETWSKFAAERHLPASEPEKITSEDIAVQKYYAAVLALASVGVMIFAFWQQRRVLACDDTAVILPGGRRVEIDSVTKLNMTKWDRGIALLSIDSGRSIKIDDYKFEGAGKIIERIREKRPEIEITSEP